MRLIWPDGLDSQMAMLESIGSGGGNRCVYAGRVIVCDVGRGGKGGEGGGEGAHEEWGSVVADEGRSTFRKHLGRGAGRSSKPRARCVRFAQRGARGERAWDEPSERVP